MKIRMFCCFIMFFFSFIFSQTTSAANTEKFIALSDIHFNPFASCKVGAATCDTVNKLRMASYKDWDTILIQNSQDEVSKIGQDTNYPLFASTMETVQQLGQEEKLQFGIVLGDFLAHNFHEQYVLYSHDQSAVGYQNFVKKTLQFMAYKLHEALPNTTIYAVIGNNDSYTGDYSSIPNGSFFHDTAETWAALIQEQAGKQQLQNDFSAGGYYAVNLPKSNKRLIALNTVLFSAHASNNVKLQNAARMELDWLNKQLTQAKQNRQHVILAFHIPPGVDVHRTVKSVFGSLKEFWRPEYQQAFIAMLHRYPDVLDFGQLRRSRKLI